MNELELPAWMIQIRDKYESDPVKWMWVGMTALVLVIIAIFATYLIRKQKTEASELLTTGLQALESREFASAMQAFQKIESSHKLSGYRDEAKLYSAAAYFGLGKFQDAEATYREYIAANRGGVLTPQAELSMGACMEMSKDLKGAMSLYQEARNRYKGTYVEKAFDIRIARLSRMLGDAETPMAIYDRIEKDTDGLWKEIARGNRRMISTMMSAASAADTTALIGAAASRTDTSGR